jgi:hypothetical protein
VDLRRQVRAPFGALLRRLSCQEVPYEVQQKDAIIGRQFAECFD